MVLVVGDCGGRLANGFFFFFLWWWWLAVGMAITGVAWTEKKMVERERHNGKIKIILFK